MRGPGRKRLGPDREVFARLVRRAGATIALVTGLLCAASGSLAAEDAALWSALRSGEHIALLRHALAPGTGDPPQFALRDCSTQRNLSDAGRDQARRIGARFRENAIPTARVYSSQWCRCLETARLVQLGAVQELPVLNSFFRRHESRNRQTQALADWLAGQELDEPLVLVTHQVNITALTDVFPASGELVIVRRSATGHLSVIGTIETD